MQYDQFVGRVQHRARLGSTGQAVAAIRATLETLAERLAGGEAKDLAAQLPREVGYYLLQGIPEVSERFGFNEFAWRVAQREGVDLPKSMFHMKAVMEVVREAVSPGELEDVLQQLPPEFAPLFAGTEAVYSNRSERRSMRRQDYPQNYRDQDRWEQRRRPRQRGVETRGGGYAQHEMAQAGGYGGGYSQQNWNQGEQGWRQPERGWERSRRERRGFDEDRWRRENEATRRPYGQPGDWGQGYNQQGQNQGGQHRSRQERGWNQQGRVWQEPRRERGFDEDRWRENQGYGGQYGQQGFSGQQGNWNEGQGYGQAWREGRPAWGRQNRGWEEQGRAEGREFRGPEWGREGRAFEQGRGQGPERFGERSWNEQERGRREDEGGARSQRQYQER